MMFWLWTALAVGFGLELFFAILLYDWRDQLRHFQHQIDKDRMKCYACITGSNITAFKLPSVESFCPEHRAHWYLIKDLESGL